MNQELVFTSAPRGLAAGKSGFCTVASTQGMATNMARLLEGLSGYRHIYAPTTPQADLNPVVYSHLATRVGGNPVNIVSRIANAGLDYSNRSNKIAHHIVIDNPGSIAGGPFAILSNAGLFFDSWNGDPQILPSRQFTGQDISAQPCSTWKATAGHEGWAGELVDAFQKKQTAFLIIEPSTPALQMMEEALSLLGPNQRWQVSFSTCFTGVPPGIECNWRCVMTGSPEAVAARRSPRNRIIDLSSCEGVPDNPYVENAVDGSPIRQDEGIRESLRLELTPSFKPELDREAESAIEEDDVGSDRLEASPIRYTNVPPELRSKASQPPRPPVPPQPTCVPGTSRDRLVGDHASERQRKSKLGLILSYSVVFLLGGLITAILFPVMKEQISARLNGTTPTDNARIDDSTNPEESKQGFDSTNSGDSNTAGGTADPGDTANATQPGGNDVNDTTDGLSETGDETNVSEDNDMDGDGTGGEPKPNHPPKIEDLSSNENAANESETKPKHNEPDVKNPHLINIDVDPFFTKLKSAVSGTPTTLCELELDSDDAETFINCLSLDVLSPSNKENVTFSAKKYDNHFLISFKKGNDEIEYGEITLNEKGTKIVVKFEFTPVKNEPVLNDFRKCVLHFLISTDLGEKEFAIPLNSQWVVDNIIFLKEPLFSTKQHLKELNLPNFEPLLNKFVTARLEKFNDEENEFCLTVSDKDSSPRTLVLDFDWNHDNLQLGDFFEQMHVNISSTDSNNEIELTIEPYHTIIKKYEEFQTPRMNFWFQEQKRLNPLRPDEILIREIYADSAELVALMPDRTIKRRTKSTELKSFMLDCLQQLEVTKKEIRKNEETLKKDMDLPKNLKRVVDATNRLIPILSEKVKRKQLQKSFNQLFKQLAIPVTSQVEFEDNKTQFKYSLLSTGKSSGKVDLETAFSQFFRDHKDEFLKNVLRQNKPPPTPKVHPKPSISGTNG